MCSVKVGGGFALANGRLTKNRIPYAAGCVGVAMAAHRMAVEYAGTRSVFGAKLADHEGIQWMLVDNEIDLRSASFIVLDAAERADSGQPFRTEVAIAKIVATEAAGRVVDRAIQIHGGYGVAKDLPLERWYRELRIRRIRRRHDRDPEDDCQPRYAAQPLQGPARAMILGAR